MLLFRGVFTLGFNNLTPDAIFLIPVFQHSINWSFPQYFFFALRRRSGVFDFDVKPMNIGKRESVRSTSYSLLVAAILGLNYLPIVSTHAFLGKDVFDYVSIVSIKPLVP